MGAIAEGGQTVGDNWYAVEASRRRVCTTRIGEGSEGDGRRWRDSVAGLGDLYRAGRRGRRERISVSVVMWRERKKASGGEAMILGEVVVAILTAQRGPGPWPVHEALGRRIGWRRTRRMAGTGEKFHTSFHLSCCCDGSRGQTGVTEIVQSISTLTSSLEGHDKFLDAKRNSSKHPCSRRPINACDSTQYSRRRPKSRACIISPTPSRHEARGLLSTSLGALPPRWRVDKGCPSAS